jgi:hypothetical protein
MANHNSDFTFKNEHSHGWRSSGVPQPDSQPCRVSKGGGSSLHIGSDFVPFSRDGRGLQGYNHTRHDWNSKHHHQVHVHHPTIATTIATSITFTTTIIQSRMLRTVTLGQETWSIVPHIILTL